MNYEFVLEVYGNRTNLEFITSCDIHVARL